PYSKAEEQQFFTTFYRLRSVLFEQEEPTPTDNPKKCNACQFKETCKFSVSNKDSIPTIK
ncbi:MAG: hypothetical protein AABY15_09200, partial [Nanoarchaeota archaeon]